MRKLKFAVIASTIVIPGVMVAIAVAQPAVTEKQCGDPKIFDVLSKAPHDCKRERISSAGGMRPFSGMAMGAAEKEWRREVLTKFGERYLNINNAACRSTECVPAAISGMTRCTISAIPCATRPKFEGSGSITTVLSDDEKKEVQRLLKVKADGNFGPTSVAALERWQRRNKMSETGVPTREVLELLRKSGG